MSDEQDTLPPGSQLSTSDLSEPPNIKDDEEYKEIHVKFTTPPTSIPSRPELAAENSIAVLPEDDPSSSSRPRRATRNVRPVRYSANDDEIAAEAEVSLEATKKRVPAKRSNTNGSVDTVTKKPAAKRAKPTPRAKKSKWDPKYVTENERSPLANVDLRVRANTPVCSAIPTANYIRSLCCCSPRLGIALRLRTSKKFWR